MTTTNPTPRVTCSLCKKSGGRPDWAQLGRRHLDVAKTLKAALEPGVLSRARPCPLEAHECCEPLAGSVLLCETGSATP